MKRIESAEGRRGLEFTTKDTAVLSEVLSILADEARTNVVDHNRRSKIMKGFSEIVTAVSGVEY